MPISEASRAGGQSPAAKPQHQFIDHAYVARIEAALSALNARFVRGAAEACPGGPWATEPLLGGHAQCGGPAVGPLNKATGVGLTGPVTDADVDRFEAFYRTRGVPPKLEMTPFADPSLVQILGKRGYRVEAFTNAHVRDLRAPRTVADPPPGLAVNIEPVSMESGFVEYSDTLHSGFTEGGPPDPTWRDIHAAGVRMPGALSLLARIGGRAAAAGSMAVLSDVAGVGIAAFHGAATLPEFRRRGAQSALLHHRLGHARESGCDVAIIHTRPGTTSERNVARFGFRLAYWKVLMAGT